MTKRNGQNTDVLTAEIEGLHRELDARIATADKAIALAQLTADRAVAKAEAAAGKEYLESQIEGLRQALTQQIIAQKEAIGAALVAAKDALTSALSASEKAISKAEEANEKRFSSVNEFRATLTDQQKTFVVKTEADYRFAALVTKLDEHSTWQRERELKLNDYVLANEFNAWRRTVDGALTTASSKSSVIYAAFAIAIALSGLAVALYNAVNKVPI